MKKELRDDLIKSIKYIVIVLFIYFLYLFSNLVPSLIDLQHPLKAILVTISGVVIVCSGILIGIFIFNYWKIKELKDLESNSYKVLKSAEKLVDNLQFKELIVNVKNSCPTKNMIIYGVTFDKTANDNEEREWLLKILNQKEVEKVIFVCTTYSPGLYTDIVENVRKFIRNVKDFSKIKNKIEIYGHEGNILDKRLTLVDHKYVLYQLPDMPADKEFKIKIQDLAIKISDTAAVNHFYGKVEEIKTQSEDILDKVLSE